MSQHALFFWFAVMVGLLAGCMLGTQPSANGFLAKHLGHPLQAATISFASGTGLLIALSWVLGHFPPQLNVPAASLPWWVWIGGAIGTVLVTTSLYFVPRIGSLNWFAAVITGQVLAALLLDQFGLMGNHRQPATSLRLVGAALLVAGILCITYSRQQVAGPPAIEAEGSENRPLATGVKPSDGKPHPPVSGSNE